MSNGHTGRLCRGDHRRAGRRPRAVHPDRPGSSARHPSASLGAAFGQPWGMGPGPGTCRPRL